MNPVKDLENIYWDAAREVDPVGLIQSRVKKDGRTLVIQSPDTKISEDLSRYKQVIVLGIGPHGRRHGEHPGRRTLHGIRHHKIRPRI